MRTRIIGLLVAVLAVIGVLWILEDPQASVPTGWDGDTAHHPTPDPLPAPAVGSSLPPPPEAAPEVLVPMTPEMPERVQLLVTDARSGRPITSGTVLARPDGSEALGPGSNLPWRDPPAAFAQVVVGNGDFPAALEVRDADPVVWIGSAGYAWKSAVVTGGSGTLHVALDPAADLVLRFSRDLARCPATGSGDAPVEIELRHAAHGLVAPEEYGESFLANPGEVRALEGIPIGPYELTARVGNPLGLGQVLVEQAFEVQPGRKTEVVVEPAGPSETATLSIFLELDGAGAAKEGLLAQSVRVFRRDRDGFEIVGFDVDPEWVEVAPGRVWELTYTCLAAGSYQVFLDPCALAQDVELIPGRESTLHFDLTAVATIVLDVEQCTVGGLGIGLIWGYQENPRRLRKYVVLAPEVPAVVFECAAKPIWVQVVGVGLASETVFLDPAPAQRLDARIACGSAQAASARFAVLPGEHSPAPDTREFWGRVRFRKTNGEGIQHAIVPWPAGEPTTAYPSGTYLGTLVFDAPGDYEVEYEIRPGRAASAFLTAGVDPTPVIELRLE